MSDMRDFFSLSNVDSQRTAQSWDTTIVRTYAYQTVPLKGGTVAPPGLLVILHTVLRAELAEVACYPVFAWRTMNEMLRSIEETRERRYKEQQLEL